MRRNSFILLLAVVCISLCNAQEQDKPIKVIVFGAHPDDCDSGAGGTAIKFAQMGHEVKFVSLTNGDAGHQSMGGGALAKIRIAESKEAGKRFGVAYAVLNNHDGELLPNLENRLKVIKEIRDWDADIVITHRPNDYHPDHRYTGILVQDAAYMVIVPNIFPNTPPLKKNPVFLYMQDNFQKPAPFSPDVTVDIDDVFEQKIYAMSAHESQYFEWLPWTQGQSVLEEVPECSEKRLEWLASSRKFAVKKEFTENLKKWYGEDHSAQVISAEAFEICEYGKQATDEEIKRLFPMLGQ